MNLSSKKTAAYLMAFLLMAGCSSKKTSDLIVGEWLLHPINPTEITQQDSVKQKMVFIKPDSVYSQSVINGKIAHSEAGIYTLTNDGKALVIKHAQTTDSLLVIGISNDTLKLGLTFEPGTVVLTRWKE